MRLLAAVLVWASAGGATASQQAFCDAAIAGDNSATEISISRGVDVDYPCPTRDEDGNWTSTALFVASSSGNVDMTSLLLREGADVNLNGLSQFPSVTVLQYAAMLGHVEVVRLLLRAGANASQEANDVSRSALHFAALKGHPRVVEVLLDEAGVDINNRDGNGNTPIFFATHRGHVEVLRLLVARGADATIADAKGFQPLYVAAQFNRTDCLRLLLDVVDPRQSNAGGSTPLHTAAQQGSNAALEILLEDGRLPIDGLDDQDRTPLRLAAFSGHFATVGKKLLSRGANASIAFKVGLTPAAIAMDKGHDDVAALLTELGLTDKSGYAGLMQVIGALVVAVLGVAWYWERNRRSEASAEQAAAELIAAEDAAKKKANQIGRSSARAREKLQRPRRYLRSAPSHGLSCPRQPRRPSPMLQRPRRHHLRRAPSRERRSCPRHPSPRPRCPSRWRQSRRSLWEEIEAFWKKSSENTSPSSSGCGSRGTCFLTTSAVRLPVS